MREQDSSELFSGLQTWCSSCAVRGLEKITLTIQRYVILDAKGQSTGSVKIKTFDKEHTSLGHEYTPKIPFQLEILSFRPFDVVTLYR